MSDAGRPGDFTDLNLEFASRLANLRAALDKANIGYSLSSGYRSPEYQNQMYQNHLAKYVNHTPLPFPGIEAPKVVAPAWRSYHNYGLAADFTAVNPNDYARIRAMAPQFGLSGIGASDPGHIQMAGTLADDINQYHLANWRPSGQPAPGQDAVAYTGVPPPPSGALAARASPGYAYFGLNNPGNIGFSDWTAQHGGKTSSATDTGHQIASFPDLATGYAAMSELALNKYSGGATTLNQLIAGKGGWTPGNTAAAANLAKSLGISPDADLGLTDPTKMAAFERALTQQETGSARQYEAFKAGKPIDATAAPAVASGATGTAAGAPPAGAGPFGGFKTQADADAFQKDLSNLSKATGGKGLGQDQGQGSGQSGPPDIPASQMVGPPSSAQNVSPLLAMTPMTYGQTINSLQDPATWYAPPGGRPQPRPQQGPMGTSLNSLAMIDPNMTPFPQTPISGMMGMGYNYPGGGMGYG